MNLRDKLLEFASIYRFFQNVVSRRASMERIAKEHIKARRGDRVLDIGCGDSAILAFLPEVEYVGIDHNARYIKRANQRFDTRGKFILGDASMKDVHLDGTFDRILILSALHHLSDELCQETLEFARNHLSPNGILISIDPVFIEQQNVIARWLAKNDRGKFVRDVNGYLRLFATSQLESEHCIVGDLLVVPYTNLIVTSRLSDRPAA